jgi:lipopolysaccharide export LptBFGC system permease protein LptF
MSQPENLGSFFSENRKLLSEYIETRIALLRLQSISMISKAAGTLIWAVIAILFVFIILIFAGLVLGFWFSELTGSYIKGFGLATLVFIVLFILITLLRKSLFVNPVIQKIISHSNE